MVTDLVNGAKAIGAALATVTTLAFASGYLVLRVRAHALGTDPNFKLLDETYVFAGFRFIFVSLMALLLAMPLVLAVRALALWITRHLNTGALAVFEWLAVVCLAFLIMLGFVMLRASGVLLLKDDGPHADPPRILVDAVLGANSVGVWVTIASVAFAALTALWLQERWMQPAASGLTVVLMVAAALQVFMLPVHHGMLYADRNVRVLDRVPPGVPDLVPPVGVVDRTGDHVAVFGQTSAGERRIVTVKAEDLNGLAVVAIDRLRVFLDRLKTTAVVGAIAGPALLVATSAVAEPTTGTTNPTPATIETGAAMDEMQRSFWTVVVDHLKATFEFIGSLNESEVVRGRIWIAEIDGVTLLGRSRLVGTLENLSWAVLGPDGQTVYALKGRQLVRLKEDSATVTPVGGEVDWRKLLGVGAEGTVLGFVVEGPFGRPAVMSPEGHLSLAPPPQGAEDRKRHAALLPDSRAYTDGRRLVVRPSERGGRGLDVFIERDGQPATNLSDCGDDYCGQPSLSPDGRHVLWVRSEAP